MPYIFHRYTEVNKYMNGGLEGHTLNTEEWCLCVVGKDGIGDDERDKTK